MRLPRRPSRRIQLVAGAVVLALAGGTTYWVTRPEPAAAQSATTTVTRGTFKESVSASGTVAPARQADLSFAVSGTVTKVLVDEGERIKRGEVIATVDDTLLEAEVTARESALEAAETQLDENRDAGASDSQLAADEAAVVNAETQLAEAQEALDDAQLRSTINGTVASLDLEVGQTVGGASPAEGSQVTIVSTGRYVVEGQLSTNDMDRVKKGLQAEITMTGGTETVYGTVQSIGRLATAQSNGAATFPVTIEVTGRRTDVYAGSSATVEIIVRQVDDVLSVPAFAVRQDDEGTYVNKMVDGRPVRTAVTTGESFQGSTEITTGLAEGDEVELMSFSRTPGGDDDRQGMFPGGPPGGVIIEQGQAPGFSMQVQP
ncbi:MAG TPA: efflux RND transporter periplasmic adaptor subunit [Nocardioidaceae bacterium]|nr:efflux RND transporter periplasmic adaptor subunit [Nocardioidaceae bacterium]